MNAKANKYPAPSSLPDGLYAIPPLRIEDDIPVFSDVDAYVENYGQIAHDHVAAMQPGAANPFIPDKLWIQLEQSTRDMVDKYVTGGRVLDVGVGTGRILASFIRFERYGIDISMEYLKIAEAAGFEVAFSRIEDMPYADGFFDAIVTCDVLEHVIDLHRCCEQIVRVLKPGGFLIVRVPYLQNLDAYLSYTTYKFVHLRSFNVVDLRLQFDKIYDCDYVEHSLVAPYYQGSHTITVQLPAKDSPLFGVLKNIDKDNHPLWPLKQNLAMSQDELNLLVQKLMASQPNEFECIKDHLLQPIETNIVFRKRAL